MNNQIAYIDEFGNSGLDFDKNGVSKVFIVTSVIIDSRSLTDVEKSLEEIRKKYFQTGEMKSSKVGANDDRRLKILLEFNKLEYTIFSIVVNKRKLVSEGFQHKKSFYKFLHSLVDRELFKIFPDLLIVADEHGDNQFKNSFIKYIQKNHIPDLFNQSEFKLSNSRSELLVQMADIISGTLARCYDEDKLSKRSKEFLECINPKISEIRFWPKDYKPFTFDPEKDFEKFDPIISQLSMNLADQFINKNERSNTPSILDQCTCLKYLLFYFRNINPEKFISTNELIAQINNKYNKNISMHYFRSKVIAKLRDNGIIISSSNKGYKLPSSSQDLFEFVDHSNSYIQPMIDRLLKCRNQIKLATKNKIDIFDSDEFRYLKILRNI